MLRAPCWTHRPVGPGARSETPQMLSSAYRDMKGLISNKNTAHNRAVFFDHRYYGGCGG